MSPPIPPIPYRVAKAFIYQGDRLLLQLRDDNPEIICPNHWGLFGGSVEEGETSAQAVQREIEEELGWKPPEPQYLLTWHNQQFNNITDIFIIPLTVSTDELVLTEGQALKLFTFTELTQVLLVPKIPILLPQVVEAINSPELTTAWQAFQNYRDH